MKSFVNLTAIAFLLFAFVADVQGQASDANPSRLVRVFVLAGQSNMQGHAVVDMDHEEHYNGGKGNLVDVLAKTGDQFRI